MLRLGTAVCSVCVCVYVKKRERVRRDRARRNAEFEALNKFVSQNFKCMCVCKCVVLSVCPLSSSLWVIKLEHPLIH